jgi:Rieske Fe-S protein
MFNESKNRRQFMLSFGKAVVSATLASSVLGTCAKAGSGDPVSGLSGKTITLDLIATENDPLNTVGGAIKISNPNDSERPMIVSRISSTDMAAFSSRCTHMGCEVPLPVNNHVTCPCHGSTFDGGGNLLGGPATTGLRKYTATLNGTNVTINA